jgi:hypothetical protein
MKIMCRLIDAKERGYITEEQYAYAIKKGAKPGTIAQYNYEA